MILAHGLGRSGLSMVLLARHLRRRGFTCVIFSYPSTSLPVGALSAKFANFIREVAARHPGHKISFVTHSMGGILLREALRELEVRVDWLGRAVMLAPPNQGAASARLFSRIWPISEVLKPLRELSDTDGSAARLAWVPKYVEIGIIAGRYDGKVSVAETHLDSEKEHVVVNSAHTFIMDNIKARKHIVNFLLHGTFGNKNINTLETGG